MNNSLFWTRRSKQIYGHARRPGFTANYKRQYYIDGAYVRVYGGLIHEVPPPSPHLATSLPPAGTASAVSRKPGTSSAPVSKQTETHNSRSSVHLHLHYSTALRKRLTLPETTSYTIANVISHHSSRLACLTFYTFCRRNLRLAAR